MLLHVMMTQKRKKEKKLSLRFRKILKNIVKVIIAYYEGAPPQKKSKKLILHIMKMEKAHNT